MYPVTKALHHLSMLDLIYFLQVLQFLIIVSHVYTEFFKETAEKFKNLLVDFVILRYSVYHKRRPGIFSILRNGRLFWETL